MYLLFCYVYLHVHMYMYVYNVYRFQKNNLILAGLWYGDVKPTMTTYVAPFVKEVNALSSPGKPVCYMYISLPEQLVKEGIL